MMVQLQNLELFKKTMKESGMNYAQINPLTQKLSIFSSKQNSEKKRKKMPTMKFVMGS